MLAENYSDKGIRVFMALSIEMPSEGHLPCIYLHYNSHHQVLPLAGHMHHGKVLSTQHACANGFSHFGFQAGLLAWQNSFANSFVYFCQLWKKYHTLFCHTLETWNHAHSSKNLLLLFEFYWFVFCSYMQWFIVPLPVSSASFSPSMWLHLLPLLLINEYFNLACYCCIVDSLKNFLFQTF